MASECAILTNRADERGLVVLPLSTYRNLCVPIEGLSQTMLRPAGYIIRALNACGSSTDHYASAPWQALIGFKRISVSANETSRLLISEVLKHQNVQKELRSSTNIDPCLSTQSRIPIPRSMNSTGRHRPIRLKSTSRGPFPAAQSPGSSTPNSRKDNTLFKGSELVVLGKLSDEGTDDLKAQVSGVTAEGRKTVKSSSVCFRCCTRICPMRHCGPRLGGPACDILPMPRFGGSTPECSRSGMSRSVWKRMPIGLHRWLFQCSPTCWKQGTLEGNRQSGKDSESNNPS